MLKDKRKNTRKALRHTAWLTADNSPLHGCVVADISDTGAKLDVENAENVPEKFVLLLAKRTGPRRLCRVVWRTEHQIGVHFEKPAATPAVCTPLAPLPYEEMEAEPVPESAPESVIEPAGHV